MTRYEWREDAACAGKPVHWFYPEALGVSIVAQYRAALDVCRLCPVKRECRDAADRYNENHGVWGGEIRNPQHRKLYDKASRGVIDRVCTVCGAPFVTVDRRQRHCRQPGCGDAATLAADAEHGSEAGYRAHRRRGENPCAACRDAHNLYNRTLWDHNKRRSEGAA